VQLGETVVYEGAKTAGMFSFVISAHEAAWDTTLTVSGLQDSVTLRNVDIGEVWVAGGQSNMEFPLRYDMDADTTISSANDVHLRFYDVGKFSFEGEEAEGFKDTTAMDRWLTFVPENAASFSAVGLYFAQVLREAQGVSIGLVGCNWAGTGAAAWLDENYLRESPNLVYYTESYEESTKDLDMVKYEKKGKVARALIASRRMQKVTENMMSGKTNLLQTLMALPAVLKVLPYTQTKGPADPNRPGALYHTMVEKIAGFSCRGVIWYQGEYDERQADRYADLFASVIRCWRDAWAESLPFLFVQLAPYEKSQMGSGRNFPRIREKQEWVSKNVENTYMVSIMDVGMRNNVHPKTKRPVGERLALMARGKIYGESVLCDPPEIATVHFDSGVMILNFLHTGNGLVQKGTGGNVFKILVNGENIDKFTVVLHTDCIEIHSPKFIQGADVQLLFAWAGYCEMNIFNSAGLPAKPFKTILSINLF
jgi:sialate O-acetylesterase